jgi:hypothetical protein
MMSARRILITRAAKELTTHLSVIYGVDEDSVQADIMGIIDNHLGSFLNNIDEELLPDVED